jgi:ABC-type antimicrobial peptide transport system ATPase subunit
MGDADQIMTAPTHPATVAMIEAMPDRLARAVA